MRISDLRKEADRAIADLHNSKRLNVEQLASALETLLAAKDSVGLNQILKKLPPEAFQAPRILSCLLRFLHANGEQDQAKKIVQDLAKNRMEISDPGLSLVVQRIAAEPEALESLPEPQVVDYEFDLHDSHYRMNLLLRCGACGCDYMEKIGWGIMVLRPTHCPHCLESRLIHPEFLVGLLKKYHLHDGESGSRPVDQHLYQLVSEWNHQEDFPAEGTYEGINLADPLLLPILRHFIREMYLERYVKCGEGTLV